MPSYSESFGLVAVEAQACGTPVVAAAAGGLRTAVQDGVSGVLIDGHDPVRYARAIADLLASPAGVRLGRGARKHASGFGWSSTVDQLLDVYRDAMSEVAVTGGRVTAAPAEPESAAPGGRRRRRRGSTGSSPTSAGSC